MRSLVVHLKDAHKRAVIDWLDSFAISQAGSNSPWLYPSASDPVLYIDFYETYEVDEPEEMKSLVSRLAKKPSITINADVSGRHDGMSECKTFISGLLREFEGVATDDFSDHFWTLAEGEQGKTSDGMLFFDYLAE